MGKDVNNNPMGFCVDIGAPRSVVGLKELHRIFNKIGLRRPTLRRSNNRFRFADATYESLGITVIKLDVPINQSPVYVELDVVSADIPALMGMDVLDRESLTPCTISNQLMKRILVGTDSKTGTPQFCDIWNVPLQRSKSQHLYAKMDLMASTYFTRTQLLKLHKQFYHPSAQKLFNLLKKARPQEASPETLRILKEISKNCDPCQRISTAPKRFRVTLGSEHVQFNERILIDLMYIEGKPILHIVDEGTKFNAAQFIENKETSTVWNALVKCWTTVYTGMPNRILVDRGTEFGNLFINLAEDHNVTVEKTGTESHSSLGLCERFHTPLRTIFRKIKAEFPKINRNLALALSVKSINDTLGPEGFVPSSLVFGEFPQVYTKSESKKNRPTNLERSRMVNYAREEMEKIMSEIRIKRALHHSVPPCSENTYTANDKVLVWREKVVSNRIGEWMGPYTVRRFDANKKLVYVNISDKEVPFNTSQVKNYMDPEELSLSFFTELGNALSRFQDPAEEFEILATEILDVDDERSMSEEMKKAKLTEIHNLLKRGTFKAVLSEEIPQDATVLNGRFVLAIKSTVDGKTICKARYVIGGHRDKFKRFIVHSLSTIQPHSVRLLLSLALIFDFEVWSSDVKQAYLQSMAKMYRDVYIRNPTEEFELPAGFVLKLLKPLYGLCDSGDLWYETLEFHHKQELNMKAFQLDPALYYYMENNVLAGLSGTYVDDMLRAGNSKFQKIAAQTKAKFEMDEDKYLPTEFTGFKISKTESGALKISQSHYLKNLSFLDMDADFASFRSMRQKLAWLGNSRPDCAFAISQLAQVTNKSFNDNRSQHIKMLNETVRYALDNRFDIKIQKLCLDTLRIVGYSDGSFSNNTDLSSQLGYLILLMDHTGRAVPIYYKSYKSRRITRSPMAAEVIAFSDMFDVAGSLSMDLKSVLGRSIHVQLLTDSKCLFDVISKGSRTSEKRVMLDIAAAKEGFKDRLISDIGLVRSKENIADGFTKNMSQVALRDILISGTLTIYCEQWIIRKDSNQ